MSSSPAYDSYTACQHKIEETETNGEYGPADEGVLDGECEGVPDVQGAGDVGWGEGDNECGFAVLGLAVGAHLGFVEALLLPPVVPGRLDGNGVVACRHWGRHIYISTKDVSILQVPPSHTAYSEVWRGEPFLSPEGVLLTNGTSSSFFGCSLAGADLAFAPGKTPSTTVLAVLAAFFAASSRRFVSFLASNEHPYHSTPEQTRQGRRSARDRDPAKT